MRMNVLAQWVLIITVLYTIFGEKIKNINMEVYMETQLSI